MSYLVLARKHRPQNFTDLIGQEHISELLGKAIENKRIAHAYLFCGPRGIGKTSCARILAKALNCEKGPTLTPCDQCSACKEIIGANSFDVLEIDGASNRGIDEIRTLRENVKFAPSYGRYKIYIVDEVHMLTTEAFNALLKTLEEPPEHVKFIFATTNPNKVPSTIISRCQRFDFKRIAINTIVGVLSGISKKEKFKIDQEALYAIAKASQGSLRDALSIMDQLSGFSGDEVRAKEVFSMLGLVETQFLFDLADAIIQKDGSMALKIVESVIDQGKDIKQLSREITEHFRHIMIIKIGGKILGKLVDYPAAMKDLLLIQSQQVSLKDILRTIDIFVESQEYGRITESIQMSLEVAIAKLTYKNEPEIIPPQAAAVKSVVKAQKQTPNAVSKKTIRQVPAASERDNVEEKPKADSKTIVADPAPAAHDVSIENIRRAWDNLTHAVSREKMSIATYLQEGAPVSFDGKTLVIGFSKEHKFHKDNLEDGVNKKLVENIFTDKLKIPIVLRLTIDDGVQPINEDSSIESALDAFKGKVVNRWHSD